MRRTLVALLLLAVCLVPAALAAAQDEAAEAAPPPLKASLAACSTGADADQRFAVFTGSMPAYPGTRRMAMRFDLWSRPTGARVWERVRGKGLSRWQRSTPGREGFVYTKRVERLAQGMDYRVTVRFRWYQTSGPKRRDRVRRTPICRQPDQRPNLKISSVTVEPGPDASTRRYVVEVLNTGLTAAKAFDVRLSTTQDDTRSIPGVPSGERTTIEFVAPACPFGDRVVARADSGRAVEESNERDNGFIAPCDGR